MGISYQLGKALKITNAFSGEALEDAQITLEQPKRVFLNKSCGFYALSELEAREYVAVITSKGYAPQRISFVADGKTDFVTMIPNGYGETTYLVGELHLGEGALADQVFQYSLQPYAVRVTKKGEKGKNGFKLQVQTENMWQDRKILTESGDMYTLGRFDFLKKEHKIQESFGKTIEAGQLVYVLFDGKTDGVGKFSIPIPSSAKDQGDLLVYVDGKMQFFAMEDKEMKLVLGGE